jgi:hypothetical protein
MSNQIIIPEVTLPEVRISIADLPEWAEWVAVSQRGIVRAHKNEPIKGPNFDWLSDHRSKRVAEIEPRADWEKLKYRIVR